MKRTKPCLLPLLLAVLIPLGATAAGPGKHASYLHALTDLRSARWLIEHRPGDARVNAEEKAAIAHIDDAVGEIQRVAAAEGEDINKQPPVDAGLDNRGRLHRAEGLLNKAREDLRREEDDVQMRDLRDRAVHRVDDAIAATHRAIADVERGGH